MDNVFTSVPGDHGAHGTFDDRAEPWSALLSLALPPAPQSRSSLDATADGLPPLRRAAGTP